MKSFIGRCSTKEALRRVHEFGYYRSNDRRHYYILTSNGWSVSIANKLPRINSQRFLFMDISPKGRVCDLTGILIYKQR